MMDMRDGISVDEAIVLAGGRGTRLQAAVSDVPKPLAPVAGRPFLAWMLDRLQSQRIRRVVLAVGYMAERIETSVGREWNGMRIDYSREASPMGTGGAVRLAADRVRGEWTHVLNGDTFLRYDMAELATATRSSGAGIGIALACVDDIARYGSVEVREGRVAGFDEKGGQGPGWINAGCYCFSASVLASLPCDAPFSLETELLVPQAGAGNVAAFQNTSGFIDIGVPEDYERAQSLFARHA